MTDRLKLFIGTGFGVGFLPFAPGTFGSLTALIPIYFLMRSELSLYLFVILIVASLLTFWVNSYFEKKYKKDPALLVTDEWAGQTLPFLGITLFGYHGISFAVLAAGLILFRLFDIWKPLGVSEIQELPHGWGVLADDLLAGFYAFICLKSLIFIWPQYF